MTEMSTEEIFIRTKIGMLLSKTLMMGTKLRDIDISLNTEYQILFSNIEKIIKDFKDYGIIK